MRTITLSIILFSMFSGFAGAQEISEWREENRTGVSAETGLLKSWPASGPTQLWSNLDLARGHSSVSFGNNKIYTTGNNGSDDVLYALDMNGKILWQTVFGRAWTAYNPEKFDLVSSFQITQGSSGPFWAHPVIHNGTLYMRHSNALMAYNIKAK